MLKFIVLVTAMGASYSAFASDCPADFKEGYFCEESAGVQILRKNLLSLEHGNYVCETETVANFGTHPYECQVSATTLNK